MAARVERVRSRKLFKDQREATPPPESVGMSSVWNSEGPRVSNGIIRGVRGATVVDCNRVQGKRLPRKNSCVAKKLKSNRY